MTSVAPGAGGDIVELSPPPTAPPDRRRPRRPPLGRPGHRSDDRPARDLPRARPRRHVHGRHRHVPARRLVGRPAPSSRRGDGVEHRTAAEPDGTRHAFAPLALVDLDARTVLKDCRPTFTPLADIVLDRGSCTVSVKPGDDLQAAVDSLPPGGGELCFAAGVYELSSPLQVKNRRRIVLNGAGPATVLRAGNREAAVVFDGCDELEVRHLRAEGGTAGAPPGDPHLEGALTFLSCTDVSVADCVLACPDSSRQESDLPHRPAGHRRLPAGPRPCRAQPDRAGRVASRRAPRRRRPGARPGQLALPAARRPGRRRASARARCWARSCAGACRSPCARGRGRE